MTDFDIEFMLAELFFLDTEFTDEQVRHAGQLLSEAGWSHHKTIDRLIRFVAPIVSGNLGYGIYPVIGEWAEFDREDFRLKLARQEVLRARYPVWMFYLQDRYNARFLKRLGVDRLFKNVTWKNQ